MSGLTGGALLHSNPAHPLFELVSEKEHSSILSHHMSKDHSREQTGIKTCQMRPFTKSFECNITRNWSTENNCALFRGCIVVRMQKEEKQMWTLAESKRPKHGHSWWCHHQVICSLTPWLNPLNTFYMWGPTTECLYYWQGGNIKDHVALVCSWKLWSP